MTPRPDPDQDVWHYAYTSPDGKYHDLWYSDADTMGRRTQLARARASESASGGSATRTSGCGDDRLLQPGVAWPAG